MLGLMVGWGCLGTYLGSSGLGLGFKVSGLMGMSDLIMGGILGF